MTVRRALRLCVALLVVLAGGSEARAATVSVRHVDGGRGSSSAVMTGETNEANLVTVSVSPDGHLIVADVGATLRVGRGCRSLDLNHARCAARPADPDASITPGRLDVRLGDGNDTLDVPSDFAAEVVADGGPGDDVLRGGAGSDLLDGGLGNDVIEGGANDRAGDRVTYASRRAPVRADLAAGRGGEGGEHDVLRGIEGLVGGHASDLLLGDGGPNSFSTAAGRGDWMGGRDGDDSFDGSNPARDTLHGDAGDDTFDNVAGDDRVRGGLGNDVAALTGRGTVSCGPGRDRVRGVFFGRQRLGADCESIGWHDQIVLRPPRRSAGRSLVVTASTEPGHADCVTQLSITPAEDPTSIPDHPPRRLIARSSLATIGRQKVGVRLRLTVFGRRFLRAHRHAVVRVNIDLREGKEWFSPRRLASYLQRLP
jgi:hemolysin type calcium-binding protein